MMIKLELFARIVDKVFIRVFYWFGLPGRARVAELADALDSGSSEETRTGSNPVAGTN